KRNRQEGLEQVAGKRQEESSEEDLWQKPGCQGQRRCCKYSQRRQLDRPLEELRQRMFSHCTLWRMQTFTISISLYSLQGIGRAGNRQEACFSRGLFCCRNFIWPILHNESSRLNEVSEGQLEKIVEEHANEQFFMKNQI